MTQSGIQGALTTRQRRVLEAVEAQGFVTIEALAKAFHVSTQTVRRDIIALDSAGLLQRFHGGAGMGGDAATIRLAHSHKQIVDADAKRRIGVSVAELIPDGSSVFLDVGTTLEAAAETLAKKPSLSVFTNSMNAAAKFKAGQHEVHVLGGQLAGSDGSLVGEQAVTMLAGLRLDFSLIGCSAVEAGGSVMDFDLRKIAIKKAALQAGRCRCLLATQTKFGRSARALVAPLDSFQHVITGAAEE